MTRQGERRSPARRPTRASGVARAPIDPVAAGDRLAPRAAWAVVLALVAIWLLLFAPQLDGRRTFVRGDAGRYSAFADFSRARFESTGKRTFWNPYVFMGLPTAGSLADARPQWLPDPLLRTWDAATRTDGGAPLWPPLLACLAGSLAAAWLARRLWACRPAGMVLAGGLWLLAPGLLVPLAFGHDAQCVTAALMPLVLLAALAVLAATTPRGALNASAAFVAALALQVLGGHPQFVAYTGMVLVPLAIERAFAYGRPRRLLALAEGTALAAAMSASLWLPAWRFAAHAQRADRTFAAREAGIWSLLPRDLLSIAWPRAVGYGDAAYWGGMRGTDFSHTLGLVAAGLALFGLLVRRPAARAARVCGALALMGMLLSLGRNFPWLGERVLSLPVVDAFRTPVTWLTLTGIAGSLLAARGLEALFALAPRAWWPRVAIPVLVLGGLMLLERDPFAEAWLGRARPAIAERIAGGHMREIALERFEAAAPDAARRAAEDLGLELVLAGGAFGLIVLARRPHGARVQPFAAAGVTLLALLPLALLVVPSLRAASGLRTALHTQPPPPLAVAAAAEPRHRAAWFEREWALSQRWSLANDWVAWRAPQLLGLSGAVPARWDQAARAGLLSERPFLRACAVRTFAMPDGAGADTVGTWADALPRVHGVSLVRAVPDDAGAIAAMHDPAWDAGTTAFAVAAADRAFPGSASLGIEWERDDPDELALRLRAAAAAFVVIADAEFPGWAARLDGRPAGIERVDLMFRGIAVPAGEHRLTLEYVPEGWRMARIVTLGAWVMFLAGAGTLALHALRDRPGRADAPAV